MNLSKSDYKTILSYYNISFVRILYLRREILKVQNFLVKKNTFLKIIKIGVIN